MHTIDLSLKNSALYKGCEIKRSGKTLTLLTPMEDGIGIVSRNAREWAQSIPKDERDAVTITGPMTHWSYLAVFAAISCFFEDIYYSDGTSTVLIPRKPLPPADLESEPD